MSNPVVPSPKFGSFRLPNLIQQNVRRLSVNLSILPEGLNDLFSGNSKVLKCHSKVETGEHRIRVLKFHNGQLFAASSVIKVFDTVSWSQVHEFQGHDKFINCLAFHGNILFSGANDNCVRSWDTNALTASRVYRGHTKSIAAISFYSAAANQHMLSGGYDGEIRRYNIKTGECVMVYSGHTDNITELRVRGDELWSSSVDGSVKCWDLLNNTCKMTYKANDAWVWDFVVSKDYVVLACQDTKVRRFDRHTGALQKEFDSHQGPVVRLLPFPQEEPDCVVSASWDGTCRLFDLATGRVRALMDDHGDKIKHALLSSSGNYVITGSDDLSVRVAEVVQTRAGTGVTIKSLYVMHHGNEITGICQGNGNVIFTVAKDNVIREWRLDSKADKNH